MVQRRAEKLIEQYLEEQLTRGMRNAYNKMEGNAFICRSCKATVPKYPGRYPSTCPSCGDELESTKAC